MDRLRALEVKNIASAVAAAGGRTFFVGGCVRDALLGLSQKDIDLEIHGIPAEGLYDILQRCGNPRTIGKAFGVYTLDGTGLDIALPRRERATGAGHTDFDIVFDPFIGPREAARRRDFTLNALMQDMLTGEILDFFGGKEDLQKGLLRHIDDTHFPEDALRVLRGAQFAARFDFTVAPETVSLCKSIDLSHLSRERVEIELQKALLHAQKPSVFFETLRECDALSVWFPEIEALIGIPQPQQYHAEGDVWNHTMRVLDAAAAVRSRSHDPYSLMLAALCHDLGKITATSADGCHAYGHETEGLPLVERFIKRLTHNKTTLRLVKNLTALHMKPGVLAATGAKTKSTNRLFDAAIDPRNLVLLAHADFVGSKNECDTDPLPFLWERMEHFANIMELPYVDGKDLIAAGLCPGPEFKERLQYAHKLRLAEISKEQALPQVLHYEPKKESK